MHTGFNNIHSSFLSSYCWRLIYISLHRPAIIETYVICSFQIVLRAEISPHMLQLVLVPSL
jgi:hypothetical protein